MAQVCCRPPPKVGAGEGMELYNDLSELIAAHLDLANFGRGADPAAIAAAGTRLGVTFPESYRWFLLWYGAGTFGPHRFYGLGTLDAVALTESLREGEPGFPRAFVAVYLAGDEVLCLDTGAPGQEAPVVAWLPGRPAPEQPLEIACGSFVELLATKIMEALRP